MTVNADESFAVRAATIGAIENRLMLRTQPRRSLKAKMRFEVADDSVDRHGVVPKGGQRLSDALVGDFDISAPGHFFKFHEGEFGLDSRRLAIHHETDGSGRGEDRHLGIAEPVFAPVAQNLSPDRLAPRQALAKI